MQDIDLAEHTRRKINVMTKNNKRIIHIGLFINTTAAIII